jgi:hypothetical protein
VHGQPTKEESVTDKLKRTLALALAGGALAIGVPAALAAGGGGDNTTSQQPSGPAFIQDQDQQDRQERPDRGPGDCPEKDGGGQGGSGESGSGSTAPDTGSATEL